MLSFRYSSKIKFLWSKLNASGFGCGKFAMSFVRLSHEELVYVTVKLWVDTVPNKPKPRNKIKWFLIALGWSKQSVRLGGIECFCAALLYNRRRIISSGFTTGIRRFYSAISGADLCWALGGDTLQFYPNFALFSTLEGMNLDHDFVQVWNLVKTKKKCKWNTFFPKFRWRPKKKEVFIKIEYFFSQFQVKTKKKVLETRLEHFFLQFSLRCTPIQIIGGDADVDHSQTIGGIYPPIPPCFGTPGYNNSFH